MFCISVVSVETSFLFLTFFNWVLYPFLVSVANGLSVLFSLSISFLISSFPHSSVGKESGSNAVDPGSILGSGRSAGEGIGYTLQYSWASLVAQPVKNPPAIWKTWVRSLGWANSLERGKTTHSSILGWRILWTI